MPDPTQTQPGKPPSALMLPTPKEKVLYQRPGVRITDKEAIIAGTIIPLESITAITLARAPKRLSGRLWMLLLLGAALSFGGGYLARIEMLGGGVLLLLVALVRFYTSRQRFHLLLDRSDGKGDAFISSKESRLEALARALHRALLQRQDS